MKLEQALNHVIAFGSWEGKTLGWIAKFEPEGVAWLHRMFWNGRMSPETREALRSFFAAPKLQTWLRKKIGREHDQDSYLLSPGSGCRCCGSRMQGFNVAPTCPHGAVRPYTAQATCTCGWVSSARVGVYVHCPHCDEAPLFQRPPARETAPS